MTNGEPQGMIKKNKYWDKCTYAHLQDCLSETERGWRKTLKVSKDLILREIAGEHILVPTGETAGKVHGMITLSESGLLLWNRLQQGCEESALTEALVAEYEVSPETAASDVKEFLDQLRKVDLLEEVPQ